MAQQLVQIPAGAIRVKRGDRYLPRFRAVTSVSGIELRFRQIKDDGSTREWTHPAFDANVTTWTETDAGVARNIEDDGWVVSICENSVPRDSRPNGLWITVLFTEDETIQTNFAAVARRSSGGRTWSWLAGDQYQAANYDPSTPGWIFVFQGTVVNGAGGAGDNSLTVTPGNGVRVEVLTILCSNLDTAARLAKIVWDDGTNTLFVLALNTALAAAAALPYPSVATSTGATFAGNPTRTPIIVAGTSRIVATIENVAASQDTAWAFTCISYGGTPSMLLAGASTPTLTVNTSRIDIG